MNIQIKLVNAFFCLFFGIATLSFATSSPSNPPSIQANNELDVSVPCNEPAPINHHFTEIRTNALYFAWDIPNVQPSEYNIKVTETSSGNVVYDQNIDGSLTTWRVLNLQPNTEYIVRNTPVCADGTHSFFFAENVATTLIVDFIVNSFTAPNTNTSCSINANDEFCYAAPAPGRIVKFKIRPTNSESQGRFFGIYKVPNCQAITIMERSEDANSEYQFYCDNGSGGEDDPDCISPLICIKLNGSLIGKFGFGVQNSGPHMLIWVGSNPQEHEIVRFGSQTGVYTEPYYGCNDGGDRSEEIWQDIPNSPTLSANPNPFTHQLNVQIPFANINENIELNLYDLQGRRVTAMNFPGGQQTITLDTEKWAPGMYFLRAESGGIVQTIKVVKTQ